MRVMNKCKNRDTVCLLSEVKCETCQRWDPIEEIALIEVNDSPTEEVTKISEVLTNGKVMEILESIAKEWATDKSDEQIEAVVDYMNTVCAKWMGGNWGLKLEHVKKNS